MNYPRASSDLPSPPERLVNGIPNDREPAPWAYDKAREVLGAFSPSSRVRAVAALLEDTRRRAILEGLGHAREVVLEELRAYGFSTLSLGDGPLSQAIEQLEHEFEQGEKT